VVPMSDFISGFFSWGKSKEEPKEENKEAVVKEKYKLHENLRPNFSKKLKQKEVIEDEE
jgi:hypothetical protein